MLARMELDPDSATPLWRQVADQLRADITSGKITGRVPSVRHLSEETGLARGTVQKAMDLLKDEGLIEPSKGRGYFVVRGK